VRVSSSGNSIGIGQHKAGSTTARYANGYNASRRVSTKVADHERVSGILTTAWKSIFLQSDNYLQKRLKPRPAILTAHAQYARAKEKQPADQAITGPIIGKAL